MAVLCQYLNGVIYKCIYFIYIVWIYLVVLYLNYIVLQHIFFSFFFFVFFGWLVWSSSVHGTFQSLGSFLRVCGRVCARVWWKGRTSGFRSSNRATVFAEGWSDCESMWEGGKEARASNGKSWTIFKYRTVFFTLFLFDL